MAAKKWMLRSEFAAHAGVSKATVTRWAAKPGFPIKGDKIDVEKAMAWAAANINPTKPCSTTNPNREIPRKPSSKPVETTKSPAVVCLPDGSEIAAGEIPPIGVSEAAKAFWDAEMRRRRVMVHDRSHIPLAEVESAADTAIGEFRAMFDGFPGLLVNRLSGLDPSAWYETIRDEVLRVLGNLEQRLRRMGTDAMTPLPASDEDADEGGE
jgi:hypothetical protein